MSPARDAILTRLQSARAVARWPLTGAMAAAAQTRRERPLDDCVARFATEAALLGIECFVEDTAEAVRTRVAATIAGERVLKWDDGWLPFGVGALASGAASGASPRDEQAGATIGLTGCDAAIAETASLAMLTAPGRARTASLLPPAHLAVIRRDQMCFTMAEYFATRRDHFAGGGGCTFITGPSRTADIELTLTLGIHGPGRLVVIVGP